MQRCRTGVVAFSVAISLALSLGTVRAAPFMIVGNDEKVLWDDQGKPVMSLPGKDSVLILDLADPLNPRIVANLSLENSVVGPPVNLDIAPETARSRWSQTPLPSSRRATHSGRCSTTRFG